MNTHLKKHVKSEVFDLAFFACEHQRYSLVSCGRVLAVVWFGWARWCVLPCGPEEATR